jgi:hypothetical protein
LELGCVYEYAHRTEQGCNSDPNSNSKHPLAQSMDYVALEAAASPEPGRLA